MSLYCCYGGDDYATVIHDERSKARKEHKCDECGGAILPGQEYRRLRLAFEGDAYTNKTCRQCEDIGASLLALGYCWSQGELKSAYREFLEETIAGEWDAETGEMTLPNGRTVTEQVERVWP